MPYIDPDTRPKIDNGTTQPMTLGELNYKITNECIDFVDRLYGAYTYDTINEIVGVLECAKMEFYRRVAAPYEDRKVALNGDVYPHRSAT